MQHRVDEMVRQRIFGLALGHEDLVDHDQHRSEPLLALAVGKVIEPKPREWNAGSCTLSRLERSRPETAAGDRYARISLDHEAVDNLLVDLFLDSYKRAPKRIVIDLDATDDPLHGCQEGRFFHRYYGHYCDLPLYIFCGENLLCARLRSANIDTSAGSKEELERIVMRIRRRWPKVQITLRADSGFCRDELEPQLYLFADRTSAHTLRANQNRLYFSSIAYVLLSALRLLALVGTELANAQCRTIRLKLLNVAARVTVTPRKIWVHIASSIRHSADDLVTDPG